MEFSKTERRLNNVRSLIAITTPVLAIYCLFMLNILYKQHQLINRAPAEMQKIEKTVKQNVTTYLNHI